MLVRFSLLGFCYAAITLPASADNEVDYEFQGTLPAFTRTGSGNCFGPPFGFCPTGSGGVLDFTLPQFNPALGTLEDYSLLIDGSVSIGGTFTNDPVSCGGGGTCPNDGGLGTAYSVMGTLTAGGSTFPVSEPPDVVSFTVPIGDDGGTASGGVFAESQGGVSVPNSALTGTGSLQFALYSEINPEVITSDEAYSIDVAAGFLDASIGYEYTPTPAPEPSLVAMTGVLFGLLTWRVSRRKAEEKSLERRALRP